MQTDNPTVHDAPEGRSAYTTETRRFTPTASETRRSNLVAAALIGALTPILGWFEGFQVSPWLLGFGGVMALATYGFYWLIARLSGPAVIEIGDHGLAIERKSMRVEVPWADIASVRFRTYGGDSMALSRHSLRGWTSVRLDGHTGEAIAEMKGMIEACVAADGGQPRR